MKNDLIIRHDAINAFYKYPNVHWTTLDILAEITKLPSAQPEIIRCKDCVWWEYEDCTNQAGMFLPDENDYCSCAARKKE